MTSIKYLDVFPPFPPDSPLGAPHIIDLNSLPVEITSIPPASIRIPDLVATVLYHETLSNNWRPVESKDALAALLWTSKNFHLDYEDPELGTLSISRDEYFVSVRALGESFSYRIGDWPSDKWMPWVYNLTPRKGAKLLERGQEVALAVLKSKIWEKGERVKDRGLILGRGQWDGGYLYKRLR